MNWQAEFLDNPEIRLTFDHFPFFQKQGIMENRFSFDYQHYDSPEGMPAGDRELVEEARPAVARAYAPYSKFRVGAAARLRSGKILCGSNQESEVFPSGMCAERSLLYYLQANFSGVRIVALATASVPGERECYPCGACRQVLADTEKRQGSPIRVVMCSGHSATVVQEARQLLPFTFEL